MRSFVLAVALVVAGTVLAGVPAGAWPVIRATGTEPAGTPGVPLVRTHFTVDFAGTGPVSDRFVLSRIDGHQILGCDAPPGWDCFAFTKGPSFVQYQRAGGPLPPPALAFALDSIDGEPCLRFLLYTSPNDVPDYDFTGCLIVDGPVPAVPSTWGAVKSFYR
jgi:hypothetical protein